MAPYLSLRYPCCEPATSLQWYPCCELRQVRHIAIAIADSTNSVLVDNLLYCVAYSDRCESRTPTLNVYQPQRYPSRSTRTTNCTRTLC
jgi:hypothetical protein